jgi:NADPH-dependent glutamate synthase beta subunit-like oxidoreductase/ferredoxin
MRSSTNPGANLLFLIRPQQLEKLPPCKSNCPNGTDIRGWMATIAQHEKLGMTLEEAYTSAWRRLTEFNPFPATIGRICPHPCESSCNRASKDGAVAIRSLERFIGDWGIEHKLALPRLEELSRPESIGVIGAGPAGLSFAYQMARRGYDVAVYDKFPQPGGMLRYGIPAYRLPEAILRAEILRIVDLGVDLKPNFEVGKDVTVGELQQRHNVLFFGIGAQRARVLRIPGENGPGVWSGINYLILRKCGQPVNLGNRVAVIGGGNTAIDAARVARRDGADVVLLYRRNREAMPAISSEIEDALAEDVRIEYLTAPQEIIREGKAIRKVIVQRMMLGEPDASGRSRPSPVEGSEYELNVDSVIAAVSQEPEWGLVGVDASIESRIDADSSGKLGDGLWTGGDALRVGIASLAIGQGRRAAEAVDASLRGGVAPDFRSSGISISSEQVKADYYEDRVPLTPPRRPVSEWLARPELEIDQTIGEQEFLSETARCLSCGFCFGCQQCWMYCNPCGFLRLDEVMPGAYFALNLDRCEGCGKCIDICPCGFLSGAEQPAVLRSV